MTKLSMNWNLYPRDVRSLFANLSVRVSSNSRDLDAYYRAHNSDENRRSY